MAHRTLLLLLAALTLGAAEPDLRLDLRTPLGLDPATQVRLVSPGIWDGLILAARPAGPPSRRRRGVPGAQVEVSDFFLPADAQRESFGLYLEDLRERLLQGFKIPPPSHGKIELAEFVGSDPSHPEQLNLTRVQSLQNRFNRLPPSGSGVPSR